MGRKKLDVLGGSFRLNTAKSLCTHILASAVLLKEVSVDAVPVAVLLMVPSEMSTE